MTTLSFYRRVGEETGQADREAVKRGTAAVLRALRDRLMPTEAAQAAAQLPRPLKEAWGAGERPDRKPVKMRRKDFYERVRREAGLEDIRAARVLTVGVFAALKEQLSGGEADDVLAQLPRDLKDVWENAR
ncbi:MAG TPA: DUF2267 domain-containing protein [Methylomirabilota bacterium]|nr:DUF2267 domain-containing protein [Methylomirabilota bacterium]